MNIYDHDLEDEDNGWDYHPSFEKNDCQTFSLPHTRNNPNNHSVGLDPKSTESHYGRNNNKSSFTNYDHINS